MSDQYTVTWLSLQKYEATINADSSEKAKSLAIADYITGAQQCTKVGLEEVDYVEAEEMEHDHER